MKSDSQVSLKLFCSFLSHIIVTEKKAQFIAAELVLSLEYLHSRGVVYRYAMNSEASIHIVCRDLQPANILLDNEGHICLTDFGISKILSNNSAMLQTACGPPAYSAPEILEGSAYTKSVDWWSLGVVLYQMILGFVLYFLYIHCAN